MLNKRTFFTWECFIIFPKNCRQNLESGLEKGGAFAVYYKGELVVDFVGGYADEESGVPWTKNTLGMFFSTTKAVSAVVIAVLVDRLLILLIN